VTLANNHFRDYGEDGVDTTLQACAKKNLDFVGGGHNVHEASTILYKNINSKTVAIINACEEEYSIATPNSGGSNPLRPIQLFYDIQKARNKADYVLLILHGGIERYSLPTPRMQETFRFLIDAGADAVINHHQHCYSGYEIYKGHLIFYGLGNFCFCNPNVPKSWNEGFMVCLTLCEDKEPSFELIPYLQGSSISQMQGEASQHFHKNVTMLNNIISSPEKLKSSYQELLNKNHKSSLMQLEPLKNSFIRKLQWHHLFPHINSTKHYLTLLDLISCESHRENMIHTLRHEIQISDD
jgi:poly-gamma-glutamate synthesis protein (capsule biosynthesis protein)